MKQVDTTFQLPLSSLKTIRYSFDPLQTTFRGGAKDPLQRWYPYLEGYSPKFVRAILAEYAPQAKVIYDPFAGVGTTPLVVSEIGLTGLYSEINPLLQFLTSVKIEARNLEQRKKDSIITYLLRIADNLEILINNSPKASDIKDSYTQTFGKSKFFDDDTYEKVLQARSLIDNVSTISPLASRLLTVSVISSLIPSSLLQRAGDLRFKTREELAKKEVNFLESIKNKLEDICSDLQTIEPLTKKPYLITEDAKDLGKIPFLGIDTIITSPPYLNGTNYFRNTKVELWFIRALKTGRDLTSFRQRSVTSGINDVFDKGSYAPVPDSVSKIISDLKKNAYDKRIPKMIDYYFQDMSVIFGGIRKHLQKENVIAIDIGDSIYGNVHVPTDKLLADVLESSGYELKDVTELRKRISRNGSTLKQVLLTFSYPYRKNLMTKQEAPTWLKSWSNFKKQLPHKNQPFSKRNWGHPLHSLCSYQGKMKPSLAYYLVKTFVNKGGTILDPFAGVGTISFEGALNGIHTFGFEISEAALIVTKAKLGRAQPKECLELINKLENYIKETEPKNDVLELAERFGFNKKLSDYFETRTLKEIVTAREFFKEKPPKTTSESIVFASLLHILHGNRPYALSRRSHGITPFAPTGNFEYKNLISHLSKKVDRSFVVDLPADFTEGEIIYQDATTRWPRHVDNLDAVITSPPFFDSTRFYLANWLRLWFSGWDEEDFEKRPRGFVDEKQKFGFDIYEPILRQARERLNPGGVMVFHLGKSSKCDMAEKLTEISKKWFKTADIFEENVEDGESHGIRDKGTVIKHQFLILS